MKFRHTPGATRPRFDASARSRARAGARRRFRSAVHHLARHRRLQWLFALVVGLVLGVGGTTAFTDGMGSRDEHGSGTSQQQDRGGMQNDADLQEGHGHHG